MLKDRIVTTLDGVSIVSLYILGSNLILAKSGNKDAWIVLVISLVIASPMLYIYMNILSPQNKKLSTLEYMDILMGKWVSKILKISFALYFFTLGGLVLRNYTEFISVVSLNKTPKFLIMLGVILLCHYGTVKDLGLLGKLATYCFFAQTLFLCLTLLLLIPQYNYDNILPMMDIDFSLFYSMARDDVTFPILESVAFLFVLDKMMHRDKSKKVLIIGIVLGVVVISFYILVSMLVLGELTYQGTYFPIYRAMARVDLLDFIQRLEILPATSFMLAGYFKISICLYTSTLLIGDVFGVKNHRHLLTPMAILTAIYSYIVYDGVIEMVQWAMMYYWAFAIPFQICIPFVMQIFISVKNRLSYNDNR